MPLCGPLGRFGRAGCRRLGEDSDGWAARRLRLAAAIRRRIRLSDSAKATVPLPEPLIREGRTAYFLLQPSRIGSAAVAGLRRSLQQGLR